MAYTFKESAHWCLCAIDERTVACMAESTSSNEGFSQIRLLNTDSERFERTGTLRIKADEVMTDTCNVKTTDGTPCLLLAFPLKKVVQCVEMVGAKVRWQVDTQQMGRPFYPWSICTDDTMVVIADPFLSKLHVFSVEDGSAITSINLHPFGIINPSCVHLQGEHIFVGHVNQKKDTYCISKFSKPNTV